MQLYRDVRKRPWTYALGYATAFFAVVSLVLTLLVTPGSFTQLEDMRNSLSARLPDGATFELKGGQLETTLDPATELGDAQFALIVDDTLTGNETPKAFENRVGMYVGRDTIFVREADGRLETMPLKDSPNLTVTKEGIMSWLGKWGVAVVVALLLMFMFFGFVFSLLGALTFVALTSLVALAASRLSRLKLDYRQWLAVGLYAVTLPTIVDFAFSAFGLDIPYVYTVLYFMFLFAIMTDERARPVKKTEEGAEKK